MSTDKDKGSNSLFFLKQRLKNLHICAFHVKTPRKASVLRRLQTFLCLLLRSAHMIQKNIYCGSTIRTTNQKCSGTVDISLMKTRCLHYDEPISGAVTFPSLRSLSLLARTHTFTCKVHHQMRGYVAAVGTM